jgi:cell division protein FtsB
LKRKRGSQFPLTQFIAIIVITISLFLVVDFARRTAATYKIRAEAARMEEEVATARARHQALQARLSYVQSDVYVEEIARTQLKWAREGETAVVVLATPQPETSPPNESQSESADSLISESSWQAWWFLFFDSPPPM